MGDRANRIRARSPGSNNSSITQATIPTNPRTPSHRVAEPTRIGQAPARYGVRVPQPAGWPVDLDATWFADVLSRGPACGRTAGRVLDATQYGRDALTDQEREMLDVVAWAVNLRQQHMW